MRQFVWISQAGHIPPRWDLRLLDWRLVPNEQGVGVPRLFDGRAPWRRGDWRALSGGALTIAVGVDCPEERVAMLSAGLGEVLSAQVAVGELAVRLTRLAQGYAALPRYRPVGPLMLDLLHRDARSGHRWLALHPREFALLWRLSDTPGERIGRERLLADVWRLAHMPETNSLEVHVSRLRAKLAVARAAWLVQTDPRGGYRLALDFEGADAHSYAVPTHTEPKRWPTTALP